MSKMSKSSTLSKIKINETAPNPFSPMTPPHLSQWSRLPSELTAFCVNCGMTWCDMRDLILFVGTKSLTTTTTSKLGPCDWVVRLCVRLVCFAVIKLNSIVSAILSMLSRTLEIKTMEMKIRLLTHWNLLDYCNYFVRKSSSSTTMWSVCSTYKFIEIRHLFAAGYFVRSIDPTWVLDLVQVVADIASFCANSHCLCVSILVNV